MVQFAESDHNRTMREYEQQCALSKQRQAGLSERELKWLEIENELVLGGETAICEYREITNKMKRTARCTGDLDAICIRQDICNKARERLSSVN